jgi:PIH1 N-terminal domain
MILYCLADRHTPCRFVVKTTDDTGRKVFINICSSDKVQPPDSWEDGVMPDTVRNALNNMEGLENEKDVQALRIPLSLSEQRSDYDKHGQACTVFDCVFADQVLQEAKTFRPMKVFVIECAMGWIQHKCKLQLDQKFKLPKLRYKGESIQEHRVRKQQKPLVTEVSEHVDALDDKPAMPLCASRPAKTAPKAATIKMTESKRASDEHIKERGAASQSSSSLS